MKINGIFHLYNIEISFDSKYVLIIKCTYSEIYSN